jgi:hypothetical protein
VYDGNNKTSWKIWKEKYVQCLCINISSQCTLALTRTFTNHVGTSEHTSLQEIVPSYWKLLSTITANFVSCLKGAKYTVPRQHMVNKYLPGMLQRLKGWEGKWVTRLTLRFKWYQRIWNANPREWLGLEIKKS